MVMSSTIFCLLVTMAVQFVHVCAADSDSAPPLPMWKRLFRNNRRWKGVFQHGTASNPCSLFIHSVQLGRSGSVYATFRDSTSAVIEVEGFSDDDKIITFHKETSYNGSDCFPLSEDFEVVGVMRLLEGGDWTYDAKFTQPKDRGLKTLKLHVAETTPDHPSMPNRHLTLGLAVGIPVTLAVILMISGIGLVVWAFRKGYLRHIPCSYKNFRNPKPVGFDNKPGTVHM